MSTERCPIPQRHLPVTLPSAPATFLLTDKYCLEKNTPFSEIVPIRKLKMGTDEFPV